MEKIKVLIIDDDGAVAKLLTSFLTQKGYRALRAADAGLALLKKEPVDVVLLDISLPGIDGIQALQLIKSDEQIRNVPVIMLTSHAEESLKVKGLKDGADDYVVKPFSLPELGARIEALLRRALRAGEAGYVLSTEDFSLDMDRRLVKAGEKQVNLTSSEYDLLASLMQGQGRVLTYRMLANMSDSREISSENIYQIVMNLRHKLGRDTLHAINRLRRSDNRNLTPATQSVWRMLSDIRRPTVSRSTYSR